MSRDILYIFIIFIDYSYFMKNKRTFHQKFCYILWCITFKIELFIIYFLFISLNLYVGCRFAIWHSSMWNIWRICIQANVKDNFPKSHWLLIKFLWFLIKCYVLYIKHLRWINSMKLRVFHHIKLWLTVLCFHRFTVITI